MSKRIASPLLLMLLTGTTSASFAQEPPRELAEVKVSGTRDADLQAQQEATSTKIIYGRDKLEKSADATVAEFLKRLPGVSISGTPGSGSSVRMLGLGKGATQILIDGERVMGSPQNQQQQLDRIPIELVERIEIIPTPTAETGGRGTAGTINIVLREARGSEETSLRIGAGANFGAQATHYPGLVSLVMGDKRGSLNWLISASISERWPLSSIQRDTQVFDNTLTRTDWDKSMDDNRNRVREVNFNPRLIWKLNATDTFGFYPLISRTEEDRNRRTPLFTYTAPATGAGYTDYGFETLNGGVTQDSARLFGIWKRRYGKDDELAIRAYVQASKRNLDTAKLEYDGANTLTATTLEQSARNDRELLLGVRYKFTVNPRHQLSTGAEGSVRKREDERRVTVNGAPQSSGLGDSVDVVETRYAAYVQDEWKLAPGHALTPGLRIEYLARSDNAAAGLDSRDTFASPSLHYLWKLNQASNLRASLARTQRLPGFDERSPLVTTRSGTLTGPDVGGNPNLRPETALVYELRLEQYLAGQIGVFTANLSWRQLADAIENRTRLEGARYVRRPYNVGTAQVWGLVLDGRSRMDVMGLPNLTLRANHAWFGSQLNDPDTGQARSLNDQPKRVFNAGFDYRHKPWNLEFGANYNRTDAYRKDFSTNEKESGVELADIYVAKKLDRNLTLRFTAGNVLRGEKTNTSSVLDTGTGNTTQVISQEKGAVNTMLTLEGKW